jgi:hypothetical protein
MSNESAKACVFRAPLPQSARLAPVYRMNTARWTSCAALLRRPAASWRLWWASGRRTIRSLHQACGELGTAERIGCERPPRNQGPQSDLSVCPAPYAARLAPPAVSLQRCPQPLRDAPPVGAEVRPMCTLAYCLAPRDGLWAGLIAVYPREPLQALDYVHEPINIICPLCVGAGVRAVCPPLVIAE